MEFAFYLQFFEKHETLGFISLYVACNVIIYVVYIQGISRGTIQINYGSENNEELGMTENTKNNDKNITEHKVSLSIVKPKQPYRDNYKN